MALPVAPPPRSDDVAVLGWHGLTVRIAWTLLSRGVKVRTEVLKRARDHVLFHLEPHTPLPHAEDQAAALTESFVAHARSRRAADRWPQDARMPLSPRWRRALDRAMEPLSEALFRKHYGDNRSLEHLEKRLRVDRVALEAARGGLREVVRRAARADGVPMDDWPDMRVDRLLVRLAAFAPGPCPPLLDVVEGGHREHVLGCARCDRTLRMLRSSILTIEDLLPPTLGARPRGDSRVLLLQFHPDAVRFRTALQAELDARTVPLDDDLLLMDAESFGAASAALTLASEVGSPHRDQLRGVLVEGPGAWSRHGLLGPLAERAALEVRQRAWGSVDGLGVLPEPLPPPPSAHGAWATVAVLLVLLVAGVRLQLPGMSAPAASMLDVAFTEGRGGVWTVFDVPEQASVSVVGLGQRGLEVVLASRSAADKAVLAVGDGSYRTHSLGSGVLVAASPSTLPDLDPLVAQAAAEAEPLQALARLVQEAEPTARIEVYQR